MHATWNQSSIMQPQINTQEQSRVNQNPIVCMTNNNVLLGIHNALFLHFSAAWILAKGGSGSPLLVSELINCLLWSDWTHWLIKPAIHEKSGAPFNAISAGTKWDRCSRVHKYARRQSDPNRAQQRSPECRGQYLQVALLKCWGWLRGTLYGSDFNERISARTELFLGVNVHWHLANE